MLETSTPLICIYTHLGIDFNCLLVASCLFVVTQILPTNQGDLKQCNISIELAD